MTYIPITPFGRPVDAAIIAAKTFPADAPDWDVDKWEVLRELCVAGKALGISDRALTVLQALLTFLPSKSLSGSNDLVVFPSNKAICERLNGMPCSTMRRHLAALVSGGLIIRRDSPNGKRYVKRYGDDPQSFGFDLTPLLHRHREFCDLAETIRAEAEALERLKRNVSLMRRDLAGLAAYGAEVRPDVSIWPQLADLAALTARNLRRTLSLQDLQQAEVVLLTALEQARDVFDLVKTDNMGTKADQIDQHIHNSNKEDTDLEPCLEKQGVDPDPLPCPTIPLAVVLKTCLDIQGYSPDPIRHWHQFVAVAETVRPMMGISPSAWANACDAMGPEQAAVTLAAMLERYSDISNPGGYLRSLSAKARIGKFSCGPMVMALVQRAA